MQFQLLRTAMLRVLPLCFFVHSAIAADTPTVTITQGHFSAAGDGLLNPIVSPNVGSLTGPSINQEKEKLSRVPGAVDLVPAEDYKDKYVVNLKDALK